MEKNSNKSIFKASFNLKTKEIKLTLSCKNLITSCKNFLFKTNSKDSVNNSPSNKFKDHLFKFEVISPSYMKEKRRKKTFLKKRLNDILSNKQLFSLHYLDILKHFNTLSPENKKRVIQQLNELYNKSEAEPTPQQNKPFTTEHKQKELMRRAFLESDRFYSGYNPQYDFHSPRNEQLSGTASNLYRGKRHMN